MELNLISKNQKSGEMKKPIKIILFIIIATSVQLFLSSCEDSLGIDSNVKVSSLDESKNGGVLGSPNSFLADSIIYSFYQSLRLNTQMMDTNNFAWAAKKNKAFTLIDTTGNYAKLWMDVDFENSNVDESAQFNNGIKDYVKRFKLKIKGLEFSRETLKTKIYILDGGFSSGKWTSITLYKLSANSFDGNKDTVNISESGDCQALITNEPGLRKNNSNGFAGGFITVNIVKYFTNRESTQLIKFVATFEVYY